MDGCRKYITQIPWSVLRRITICAGRYRMPSLDLPARSWNKEKPDYNTDKKKTDPEFKKRPTKGDPR
jgi:hypothetical protein